MSSESNDKVSMRMLVLAVFLSIAGTVGVLDWQGKIVHPQDEASIALASYKVIFIPEGETPYRLSPKPSHQTAFCESGYVFIGNDKDQNLRGLLVDYKNRGVKCPSLAQPEAGSMDDTNDEAS